jgi:TolB-like protein
MVVRIVDKKPLSEKGRAMLKHDLSLIFWVFTCENCGKYKRLFFITLLVIALAIGYYAPHWHHAFYQKDDVLPYTYNRDILQRENYTPVEDLSDFLSSKDEPQITAEGGSFSLPLDDLAVLIAREIRKQGKDKIMVFDFHDQDGKTTPFGFQLTHEISKGLAEQPGLRVVRVSSEIGDPFTEIDAAVELGLSLGADCVCIGRVYDPAEVTRIELEVIDVNSKKTLIGAGMPVEKEEVAGPAQKL